MDSSIVGVVSYISHVSDVRTVDRQVVHVDDDVPSRRLRRRGQTHSGVGEFRFNFDSGRRCRPAIILRFIFDFFGPIYRRTAKFFQIDDFSFRFAFRLCAAYGKFALKNVKRVKISSAKLLGLPWLVVFAMIGKIFGFFKNFFQNYEI